MRDSTGLSRRLKSRAARAAKLQPRVRSSDLAPGSPSPDSLIARNHAPAFICGIMTSL
jgi:hypothetical protein